ncbi:MAG: SDR family NAD(P)-dependent oxidoreductase [Methylovulum sp.]|nr:SDR family NAD(P)-dependent oxidoreductase [Methylovulum sp.]
MQSDAFLMSAAAKGLFPYPHALGKNTPIELLMPDHFERRAYQIRPAELKDLTALQHLEELCWAEPLRTPVAVLQDRVVSYPAGQWVLVVQDTIAGVIYSQRIADADALQHTSMARVADLHRDDGRIVQLLAVNILPTMQGQNLGDQLLEFMLLYCSLQTNVDAVLAISLCKNYDQHTGLSLAAYIHARNGQGVLLDPILRFHELHGAKIEGLIHDYRPQDSKNEGCGVLVSYDLSNRSRNELAIKNHDAQPVNLSRSSVLAYLQNTVLECLGEQRKSAFAPDRPLMEMGLDSTDLLQMGEKIADHYQHPLKPAFFFQYNTTEKVLAYLLAALGKHSDVPSEHEQQADDLAVIPTENLADYSARDIAIIGMACRLPGNINTPDELWELLKNGCAVIGDLPAGRWQWPADIEPGHPYQGIGRGGFLADIACFDAPFFRISAKEAEYMDPQQRILLELAWQTLEHAGYAAGNLADTDTGVFIGASGSDYSRLLESAAWPVDAHFSTGGSMAVLANRISYFFDFHGPSLLVDTACSSSLVAVHKAVQSLQSGECPQALVGGINLICHPANSLAYYKAGMLAPDGACKTFDQQANGYVRSEGAVMLLLKPMTAALLDNDQIFAVIKGSACNHGGLAGGLTVPNPVQQSRLLQSAWQAAAIAPQSVSYIETHGTGTALGDPIEIQGLQEAFLQAMPDGHSHRCGLGAGKTNLGHLEAAAGIAGLLKTVLSLQHRELPAVLHFTQLNGHIQLSGSGFYVVARHTPWAQGAGPRRAGVSSFGSGGANAHVVVEEFRSAPAIALKDIDDPIVFVLSAKNKQQLLAYAQSHLDGLRAGQNPPVVLRDLAYTLQIGRQAMDERLAFLATDRQDVIDKLSDFCSRQGGTGCIHQFNIKTVPAELKADADAPFMPADLTQQGLDKIALLWACGAVIDWPAFYCGDTPRRISLPTYPFAKHHYWLPETDAPTFGSEDAAALTVQPAILAPVWRQVGPVADTALFPKPDAHVLIVGGMPAQQEALCAIYPGAQLMAINPLATADELALYIAALGALEHIVWIAPDDADSFSQASVIDAQQHGLLHIFRLLKALLALAYDARQLGWTFITTQTQAVFGQNRPNAAHAGVHGLVGAMAKECPQWRVRLLDMDAHQDWPLRQMFGLPVDGQGEGWAYRSKQWFRQALIPVRQYPSAQPAYRQNGVYIVIGGAGGLGEAWSRYMVDSYQAQIIWIGRRRHDAGLQEKLATFDPEPLYISADAADPDALQQAYVTIKQRYPAIHGVIHSAVGLFDDSLATMPEPQFRAVLAAKIDISVNMVQVFQHEPLDFMLFFSSIVAFEKNGGLSGYAAGCAFADAFALQMATQLPFAVKVINWGHWRIGTGDAISDAAKKRLQHSGIVAIEPEEAMAALQLLLTVPLAQLVLVKMKDLGAFPVIEADEYLDLYAVTIPAGITAIHAAADGCSNGLDALKPASIFQNAAMEAQLWPLFAGVIQAYEARMAGPTSDVGPAMRAFAEPKAYLASWLAESRSLLKQKAYPQTSATDLDGLWRAWHQGKPGWCRDASLQAAVTLVETCLQALPDILSGRQQATEIIFPDASMRLLEGIYQGNSVSDYFNAALGDALVALIQQRLQQDPDAQLRLLEIGAGTGGTTAMLLPKLRRYSRNIAEYSYTDISKAFLFHAEERYVPDYPFVHTQLFDVGKPPAGQGIAPGQYDAVIATNVLHATGNIRRTLANAKALLHKQGALLLNEICDKSLFAHLTFGLLEGWWLSEDPVLRIPGSPALYPAAWQSVLQEQGFYAVRFPEARARMLGQQIIAAASDGVVRQYQRAQTRPEQKQSDEVLNMLVPDELPVELLMDKSRTYLKKLVAGVLRMKADDIDVAEPLETYGLDSILIVQITNKLREVFGDVSRTLLFECQTLAALVDYFISHERVLLTQLTGLAEHGREPISTQGRGAFAADKPGNDDGKPQPAKPLPRTKAQASTEPIAVIGMSCRFPKADTLDEYWDILKSGQDCIVDIPQDRWPVDGFYHEDPDTAVLQGKSYCKWGGFLEHVTDFDPMFFNISPKEAVTIDPQERLFLQAAWAALEDAGYTREDLRKQFRQKVGVFAGITRTGFDLFGPELWRSGETIHPHTSFSSVANRLSYFLNLRGPSMPVDTMCSSSLTAIHQACQHLRHEECEMAFAGGVNLYLHPSGYVGLSAARMLSKDGRCKSFGKDSNGFVPGEGVGVVLLKPLSRAIADGDHIYASIRSSHINHGGKTNGYTVPNPQAQAELVRESLQKAGVNARAMSYVEAHGTGTELGDPIEITALTQAYQNDTADTGFCALGSVKANIGHLEAAAGIAGFIKVVLQMRHEQLAPSLHAAETNPNIDFGKTPFVVQQTLAQWQRPVVDGKEYPRLAGVSSFGAGGANAHIILEEYSEHERVQPSLSDDCLIMLSAKNEGCLRAYARKLHDFIAKNPELKLSDVAYTLQVGREAMDERLAISARSIAELQQKLHAFIAGQDDIADLYRGQAHRHKDILAVFADDAAMGQTIAAWMQQRSHAKLLTLWTQGLAIDWTQLHQASPGNMPRRISLPTYAFAGKPYWLPLDRGVAKTAPASGTVSDHQAVMPTTNGQAGTSQVVAAISKPLAQDKPACARQVPAKPSGTRLADLAGYTGVFQQQAKSGPRSLPALHSFGFNGETKPAAQMPTGQSGMDLRDFGQGVFALHVHHDGKHALDVDSICTVLIQGFAELRALADASSELDTAPKVLLLTGLEQLSGKGVNVLIAKQVPQSIVGCDIPVIAVLKASVSGIGWFIASLCELLLCSAEGRYHYDHALVTDEEYQLFVQRFGEENGLMLLSANQAYTGKELKKKGLSLTVLPETELDGYALELACALAQTPRCALVELKKHLARPVADLVEKLSQRTPLSARPSSGQQGLLDTLTPADQLALAGNGPGTPVNITIKSAVVTVEAYQNGVVLVTLCEKASKNTFTPDFVSGVIEAFEHIRNTAAYKVVVLTGYGHYFACGGTRQGLLAIQNGSARFTDEQSYSAALTCDIPVIAAMQGHAIGAGWAMGLFCDAAVYSEESSYQSPYMLYGFTPGAGSTLIFPHRLGYDLSRDILFTAKAYPGRELKQRGIGMPVIPRAEVLAYALAWAGQIALAPRERLIKDKQLRAQGLRNRLETVYAQELAMHDKTFVGSQSVIANIQRHFNDAFAVDGDDTRASTPVSAPALQHGLAAILSTLRLTLAEELSMQPETVNDDMTFIDMGMDSITAVTWIRKLNKHYGLVLEATQVYRYPTLTAFAGHLHNVQPAPAPDAPVAASATALLTMLRESLAAELYLQPDMLDDDMTFIDMGMDSITAVTWVRKINKHYGLAIGATKIYSYPNLREFYQYILKDLKWSGQSDVQQTLAPVELTLSPDTVIELGSFNVVRSYALSCHVVEQGVTEETPQAEAPQHPLETRAQPVDDRAIAIIGMAGQFPKAKNLQQFWDNLVQGRDCVSDIPPERWSIDDFYSPDKQAPGKTVCRRMGALDDVEMFDPLFFNISPYEAELMDPQQRLFLQACWHSIEDAGYNPMALSGSLCGVFAGCAAGDYARLLDGQTLNAQALMGESVSILPARIAYFLNLQGPSLALDTACSSSLVAIANACDSLLLGHSDLALAGGVYVITGPEIHVKMSQSGMLSPDGRCYSFDQRANGFVPGEGVGVLVLKRLAQAEQDGDAVYGVIRGWGVNQDGKTNGITAPNPDSQTRLEKQVYQRFGINPEHIQMLEAHGTGTKLGDPIEVDALRETFKHFTDKTDYCALGSVKSNIGHLATAAGVSGVFKALLALRHRQIPPTINYQTLNEHIRLQDSPFYVNTTCRDWPVTEGQERLAAISSFGFSGTNAHLVLAEYRGSVARPLSAADKPVLFVLSAKTQPQLIQYAASVKAYLETNQISLDGLAYTYQTGREAMAVRLAIVATSADGLGKQLAAYVAGETGHDVFAGVVDNNRVVESDRTVMQTLIADSNLKGLASYWVNGGLVAWQLLPGQKQRLHGLPGYPFATERYWLMPRRARRARLTGPGSIRRARRALPIKNDRLWFAEEVSGTFSWNDRLQCYQDAAIAMLYDDDSEQDAVGRLLTQLEQAAGLRQPLNLQFLHAGGPFKSTPDVLLVLATEQKIQAAMQVLATASKPVRVFCLFDNTGQHGAIGALLSTIKRNNTHYWTLITKADSDVAGTDLQILLKEWLAHDYSAQYPPSWTEIRYSAAQRWVRQAAYTPPQEASHLIVKSWREQSLDTAGAPSGDGRVVILANQESVSIAAQLMQFTGFKDSVLLVDGQQSFNLKDAEASKASANTLQGVTLLIDLSDLYAAAKNHDADSPGKISFYQTLMGAYTDISLLYFTKGLQHFQSELMSLAGAKFAGLVKMLSAEYPHVNAKFIDIDPAAYGDARFIHDLICSEYATGGGETELCYRQGRRFAPYLHIDEQQQDNGRPFVVDATGVYVISGGTNGVGLEIAQYLAAKGCNNLVLMGIQPLPDKVLWETASQDHALSPYLRNKLNVLSALDKAIPNLQVYTGPLTEFEPLARYFNGIRARFGAIKGVIHSAGVYSDWATPGFATKSLARMQQVFEPKIQGLETLQTVFNADALDFFVTFSSLTGLMPRLARGASDYAMANSFVDFFSAYHYYQNKNTAYKTITWSDWNETGAITRVCPDKVALIEESFRQIGLRTFSNRDGCALFERAMAVRGSSWVFPAYLEMACFNEAQQGLLLGQPASHVVQPVANDEEASPVSKLLAQLTLWEAAKQPGMEFPVSMITDVISFDEIQRLEPDVIHRIYQLMFAQEGFAGVTAAITEHPPAEQPDISHIITKTLAEVLKLNDVDHRQSFQNYGLDSISAMVLATRLEKKLQQSVQPRWLIDFSTVESLSRHLLTQK